MEVSLKLIDYKKLLVRRESNYAGRFYTDVTEVIDEWLQSIQK